MSFVSKIASRYAEYSAWITAPSIDRQNALLHVLQHGLNVGGLLFELRRAFLDLLDHAVERDDRMADLIQPAYRHAAREVLARRDLAHHGLHAAERTRDLAVEQRADQGQQNDRDAGDDGDSGRGGGERVRSAP